MVYSFTFKFVKYLGNDQRIQIIANVPDVGDDLVRKRT